MSIVSREKLIRILEEINPDIDYNNEKALVDKGLFDSLDIMSLIIEIDDVFNIEIDPGDIIPDNFNSVEDILNLIENSH